jgi:hypothetical protein
MAAQIWTDGLSVSGPFVYGPPSGDTAMSLPLRPLIGFGAAFAAMAMVVIAGMTAPRAETIQHASAQCPDELKAQNAVEAASGAERPA